MTSAGAAARGDAMARRLWVVEWRDKPPGLRGWCAHDEMCFETKVEAEAEREICAADTPSCAWRVVRYTPDEG